MSDYLPDEILTEILIKLPVKSLIRGTSVRKRWQYLIKSPYLISTHLSHTQNQAFLQRNDYDERREHYTVIPKRGPFLINSDTSELEFPFKCPFGCFFIIVGSCDGLVCLSDEYSQHIIIWNSAIRNHVVLPQPLQLVNPIIESHLVVLGFGVASNVYKVVRLVYRRNPNGHALIVPPQAEIFCLGTDRWRKLTGFDVRGLVPQYQWSWSPIFLEGFVHWIGYENSERNSILRFHVGDEVFSETMLPRELEQVPWSTSVSLYMIGEKLGAFKYDDRDNLKFDVWMMKDYGVKESWTKLYTIDIFEDFNIVIGFWGSSEAVLDLNRGELVTYNAETKEIKHVRNFGKSMSFYVGDYKESLVLLGGGYSGDSGKALSRSSVMRTAIWEHDKFVALAQASRRTNIKHDKIDALAQASRRTISFSKNLLRKTIIIH